MTSKAVTHPETVEANGTVTKTVDMNAGRRAFIRSLGLGTVAGSAILGVGAGFITAEEAQAQAPPSDNAILNFALNLEYLEAEFYLRAAFGRGLADADTTGRGQLGPVRGGSKVPFQDDIVRKYAEEIAIDEENHVQFIRSVLGDAKVARPQINLQESFTAAARAAGLVGPNETFNPFQNDVNFLLGAFIFEDVGVTAYKGAAPLIVDKGILSAAAGILAVEAYHAGEIRTVLYARGLFKPATAISNARDTLDSPGGKDQGIGGPEMANIVPADQNSLAFGRTPRQVLNIVYLERGAEKGGFFPQGVNGQIGN